MKDVQRLRTTDNRVLFHAATPVLPLQNNTVAFSELSPPLIDVPQGSFRRGVRYKANHEFPIGAECKPLDRYCTAGGVMSPG